jgi:hypothetical protein
MRHLLDLRDLRHSTGLANKLARNALETHLVALFSLLAVDVPAGMRTRLIPRLQHRRRLAQARLPLLRQAPLPIAILDYRNYREWLGASNKKGTIVGDRKWPKSDTLAARYLASGARARSSLEVLRPEETGSKENSFKLLLNAGHFY